MKILVACEESQRVCISFRQAGFDAWSCDLLDQSGGYPEWHIRGDAIKEAYSGKYDMLIAFPPCTYISKAGALRMFPNRKLDQKRFGKAMEAKKFFLDLLHSPIKHIAIENPTPLKIVKMPNHTQAIQPYQFGDPFTKRTLLWLKNLPCLRPTIVIDDYRKWTKPTPWVRSSAHGGSYQPVNVPVGWRNNGNNRRTERSKTFWGIARAMSSQWTPEKIAEMPEQIKLFK